MKITYHITRDDFIDAQKLHRSKSPGALGRAIVVIGKILAGASVLLLIALAAVNRDRRLWANLAPLVILLAAGRIHHRNFRGRRSHGKPYFRRKSEVGAFPPIPGVGPGFPFVPDKSNVQLASQVGLCLDRH
jgi:hypothetical protein